MKAQCIATAASTGRRCTLTAVAGSDLCRRHGGATLRGDAAAESQAGEVESPAEGGTAQADAGTGSPAEGVAARSEEIGPDTEAGGDVPREHRRVQSVVAVIMAVLASVGVMLSALGVWAHTTVFDTESFMEMVEPALAGEEVAVALTDFITEEAVAALDLESRLEERLGAVDSFLGDGLADILNLGPRARELLRNSDLPRFADLAAPLEDAVAARVRSVTDTVVRSEQFLTTVSTSISIAHRGAVALIRDGASLDNVDVVDGEVRLNLVPIIGSVLGQVVDQLDGFGFEEVRLPGFLSGERAADAVSSLSDALGTVLPADFGQVTVMSEERLQEWQATARTIDRIVWGLVVITVVFAVAALVVSQRRRRTLIQLALGGAFGFLLAVPLERKAVEALESAVTGPQPRAAAQAVLSEVLGSLRAWSFLLTGAAVLVALGAYLAGRPAWLQRLWSRAEAGYRSAAAASGVERLAAEHRDGLIAGGFAVAWIALLLVGLGILSVLIIGGLLGLFVWYVLHVGGQRSAEP
jgi:hypothetical protein